MAPITKKKHILSTFMCESSNHQFSDSDSNAGMAEYHHRRGTNDSNSSLFDDDSRQFARVNRVILDKNSDEYRKRRERNNLAVKKSRTKSKLKTMETLEKVSILKAEKDHLQRRVDLLSRELRMLKNIFMAHASNAHGTTITEYDLKLLTGADLLDFPPMEPSPPSIYDEVRSRTSSSASSHYGSASSAGSMCSTSYLHEALVSPSPSPANGSFPRGIAMAGIRPHQSNSLSSRSSHDSEDDF